MPSLPQQDHTLVMGILNVTPDSFSDGGEYLRRDAAIAHGLELLAQGAAIVDVGGESTRPGAQRAPVEVELDRVIPVVEALVAAGGAVSVDTMRAEVARAAVAGGAVLVNDVSGGLADPEMLPTVAELGVAYVAMHWRGHSEVMQSLTQYEDVVADVATELAARRDAALAAGIAPEKLILDPGLGFAKTPSHNWLILHHLGVFQALGHRLLIGASRKRFLGELLTDEGTPRPVRLRDNATAALSALLAARGVWGVRTHTVGAHLDAIAVADAVRRSTLRTTAALNARPVVSLYEEGGSVTDRIQLTGIEVLARHGVFTAEKFTDQPFVIDLDCVLERPALLDELDTTVDYGDLAQLVATVVKERSVDLIETLAERIAAACFTYPVISSVVVTVHKPEAPMPVPVRDVAVRVTRRRP